MEKTIQSANVVRFSNSSGTCALFIFFLLLPTLLQGQDQFFDSDGVRIRYFDQGSGEAVVLIHGFSGNLERTWVDIGVFGNLARDHRTIALDLRGHGKSGKPHEPRNYGGEVAQDVIRLLDHLKITRANLIGHSMGGTVVLKLVTTNPGRVLTAILAGSAGRRNWSDEDTRTAEATASEFETGVPFRSVILRTWPTDQPPPSEDTIRKLSQQAIERGNDPAAIAALLRAQRGLAVTDAELASVHVLTLAIVGSADNNLSRVTELKKVMPSLKVEVVEGATHAEDRGVLRHPEFLKAVREFMSANVPKAVAHKHYSTDESLNQ